MDVCRMCVCVCNGCVQNCVLRLRVGVLLVLSCV